MSLHSRSANNSAKGTKVLAQACTDELIKMFDLLPDTLFWIKDQDSKFLHVNQSFIEHTGLSLNSIVGSTDFSICPPHIARQFISDDQKVMRGELISDRLEINRLGNGEFGWFSTSKRPLNNSDGMLIGTYGISYYLEQSAKGLSRIEPVRELVDYIRSHYSQEITVSHLADLACLSVSALERRFKRFLGKTPNQFITKVRLENARRLLIESRLAIIEVAYQCGYTEHSYFSKQFKLEFGLSPSELRDQYSKKAVL